MDDTVRHAIAARVARDIPEGAYVNLGVGLPTLVANHLSDDKDIILHSENGVLGRWVGAPPGQEDWEMINAGKEPIMLRPGAAFFHQADSFGMMRGGHLDICVLGAFQVSRFGDLANWHTGKAGAIPAVGGAMDLACGAKSIYVMMEHCDRTGRSKLLDTCTYPLTGLGCISRVYTELGTFNLRDGRVEVMELVPGVSAAAVAACTDVPLDFAGLAHDTSNMADGGA